jgi:hypothetical protein
VRVFLLTLMLFSLPVSAQIFRDDFEDARIQPAFPLVNNVFQLPNYPVSSQISWFLSELAAGETTTAQEVNDHFDASWLAVNDVNATINFIASVRAGYPNAQIVDVVSVTPMRATALIDTPGSGLPSGFMSFGTRFSPPGKIVQLGVNSFSNLLYPEDTNLTLTQAADKFATLSSAPGLLIARINSNGQCLAMEDRSANQLRATASVFKIFSLGAVSRMIADEVLSSSANITLDGSKNVGGSVITSEPVGTVFSVNDMATMMMGNSDNTATDHLHARVGRARMNQAIDQLGVAQASVMTPFLGISETFHLFHSFSLADSLSYVNGTEAFQQSFLDNQIVPLGRYVSGPNFHTQLLTEGSWRVSAFDLCRAFAALRRLPKNSDAFRVMDRALSSQAAQPQLRPQWDRVWYKGGSLLRAAQTYDVFTHAWLVEDTGRDPYVVIALSNSNSGGISQLTTFQIQSVTARMFQILATLP